MLKKLFVTGAFCAAAALTALTGCGGKTATIADYYPFDADTLTAFVGGDEYSSYTVYNRFVGDGGDGGGVKTAQRRLDVPDNVDTANTYCEVLTLEKGELRMTYSKPNYYGFDDARGFKSELDAVILKEPLKLGQKWVYRNYEDGASTAEITSMAAKVTVPYGTFDECLEVTITDQYGTKRVNWYAKGIGLVRAEFSQSRYDRDGNGNIVGDVQVSSASTELAGITKGVDYDSTAAVFMMSDESESGYAYRTVPFKIKTNESAEDVISQTLRNAYGLANMTVKEVKTNHDDFTIDIDLSEGLADANAFKCVVSTLCYYYDCFYAKVTVNGAAVELDGLELDANGRFEAVSLNDALQVE